MTEEALRAERGRGSALLRGLAVGGATALLARDLDLATLASYWGSRSPLVVAVTLLVAGLWVWAERLRPWLAALAIVLATAWAIVAFTPVTRLMAEGLVRRDPEAPADAIFVLASAIQKDGELTAPAMARLVHGLELLGRGLAPRIVVSELPLDTPAKYKPYAVPARALEQNLGLQQEVLAVGPVHSTREEALKVAELFRERGWKRVLLVTEPTHSRRASAAFEAVGLTVTSSPSVETQFDLETLSGSDDRLHAFGEILHERVGLLVYRWRGWIR